MPQDLSVGQIDLWTQDQMIPHDLFMPQDPFMLPPFLSEPYDLGGSGDGQYSAFPNNFHEQHFHEQHLSHTMSTGNPFPSQVESACLESGDNLSSYHPYDPDIQLAASALQQGSTIHSQQIFDQVADDQFGWMYNLTNQNNAEFPGTNEPTSDFVPTITQIFDDLDADSAFFQRPVLECISQTELCSFLTEEPTVFPPLVLSRGPISEPQASLAVEEPMDIMEASGFEPEVSPTTQIHYGQHDAYGKSDRVQRPPRRTLFGPSRLAGEEGKVHSRRKRS
ncbi:unnamed protein product [Penicillium pancosmium]